MQQACALTRFKKSSDKKGVKCVRVWLEPFGVFLGHRLHSGILEGYGSMLEYIGVVLDVTHSFDLWTRSQV